MIIIGLLAAIAIPAGRNGGDSRNGHRTKTILTGARPVEIEVPRDQDGSFEPVIVKKRSGARRASTRSCSP